MPVLISYLLKFSISISSVYLFYQILLRRLTFYNWNRWFLLGYSALSFIIPFINISPIVEEKKLVTLPAIHFIPTLNNYTSGRIANISPDNNQVFNYWNVLIIVFAAGALVLFARFIVQYLSVQKIKRTAKVMTDERTIIYEVPENIIPFSFGNSIFINPKLHTEKEFEEIILHEYVHVKQKHTTDILFAEFLCIINWYNPFAWLIRYAIKQNLEFIADHFVLQKGFDKKAYQYHLLKVIGSPQYRITNNFNFSSLKKRIVMMNALKSAKVQLGKFLFLLPLIAILLLAFRDKYEGLFKHSHDTVINEVGIVADIASKQPLQGVLVTDSVSGKNAITDSRGFYEMKIPVSGDSVKILLHYSKAGYENGLRGTGFAVSKMKSHGLIDVLHLRSLSLKSQKVLFDVL
ncbi:MAG: M56 family metallopeptidase, partial [Bacteroidetes bacterium]|nr:M56 family metallopeptidase [Bacteroidota bacterium]